LLESSLYARNAVYSPQSKQTKRKRERKQEEGFYVVRGEGGIRMVNTREKKER